MIIEDPKTSADETQTEGDDNPDNEQGPPDVEAQDEQERLKRFIWTEGDFEFEDDEA